MSVLHMKRYGADNLYRDPNSWMEAIHPDDLDEARTRFASELAGKLSTQNIAYEHLTGQKNGFATARFPFATKLGS